ncbi:hypothetical protein NDU88_010259 [Pleurodeles waltl]|uniref:Uncharacterized protein n=1 Tax=Pleurodeles waltl TaxID=8319 RepID=A0AAV7PYB1_PLEWA|nr:hypothetical protein NDU88_010259 [Pleurodeles waltl]
MQWSRCSLLLGDAYLRPISARKCRWHAKGAVGTTQSVRAWTVPEFQAIALQKRPHSYLTLENNSGAYEVMVNRTISKCFIMTRTHSKVPPYIPVSARKADVVVLISRLNYYDTLYQNISKSPLTKLQTLQNGAARLTLDIPNFQSILAEIIKLPWQPVKKLIMFKAECIAHKALRNSGLQQSERCFTGLNQQDFFDQRLRIW